MAGLFPGRRAVEPEVFLSSFSSAEAKNVSSYRYTSLYMPSWRGEGHSWNTLVLSTYLGRFYIMRVEDFILLLLVISNYKEVGTSSRIPALHPLFHSWISVIQFCLLTATGAVLQA
jgi:hypothetical protein